MAAGDEFRAKLAGAGPVPNAPDDSFLARLRGTGSRTLQNPLIAGALGQQTGLPPAAIQYGGQQLANPRPDGVTQNTHEGGPQVLVPSTQWTDVQPVAPLQLTQPKVGGAGGTGGASPGMPGYFDDMKNGVGLIGEEANRQARLGVAETDALENRSVVEEEHAAQLQDIANQEKAANVQAAEQQKTFLAQSQKMSDDLAKMDVDPGRLWHDKSAGDRIGFGIAAALSGLASGISGKPDQFINQWSAAIDRDIDAQKTAIETKKASISARNSVFGQMLQQSGDERTAREATKALMLQGLAQKVKATSDRLGIPVIAAKSDLLVNGLDQKKNQAQTGVNKAMSDFVAARAAAAAAASERQRKEQYERTVKGIELDQKQQEIDIKRGAEANKGKDDMQKRQAAIGKELADPKLANGRATVDALDAAVAKNGGDAPTGLGYGSAALRGVLGDGIASRLLPDDANINKQNYDDLMGIIRNQKTGSGSSEAERLAILKEAEGAGTWAEKKNAIAKAKAFFAQQENAVRAGDPDAAAAYDAARGQKPGMPGTVKRSP